MAERRRNIYALSMNGITRVKCNPVWGLQAAIVKNISVNLALAGGLVLDTDDPKKLLDWREEYWLIVKVWAFRWNIEDWYDRGYRIKKVKRPGSFRYWQHKHSPYIYIPVKIEKDSTS